MLRILQSSLLYYSIHCASVVLAASHSSHCTSVVLQRFRFHSSSLCVVSSRSKRRKRSKKDQEKMRDLPVTVAALLAILLVAASYQDLVLTVAADGGGVVPDGVCDAKCQKRCSMKVAGRCMGLCKMCCGKCGGCVPSGPYASKDECPCYRDMVSPKSRRPKCP
uniref:Gibberellin regulated protein n=2 Tax=Oryza brachyantha TaxID=4533 RepID=J3MMK2_ORYBR